MRETLAHHRLISGRAAENGLPGSPAVREGRELVKALACRRCHVAGGAGNRWATSLDRVVWSREVGGLTRSIEEPVEFMPRFGMGPPQIQSVIAFLLHGAARGPGGAAYQVRFAARGGPPRSVFDERCGGCHRALLAAGPAGIASAGPNLSGLLSDEYPASAPGNEAWTPALLKRWLDNPRSLRPQTTMRPVRLEEDERRRLLQEFLAPDRLANSVRAPRTDRGAR